MSIEINGAGVITGVDSLSTPAVTNTAGSASAPSITFTGDTNTGVYSPGADQVAISTGGSGRLFVDANGRLGIGASPALSDGGASLQLYTNGPNTSASVGNAAVTLQSVNRNANLNLGSASTGTSSIFFHDQSGLGTGNAPARIACTISEKNLLFETGGVPGSSFPQERLRITSAGLVGVGTSSPGYPLTVKTTTDGGQAILDLDNQDVGNYGGLRVHLGKTDRECRLEATYGSSFFSFYTDNAEQMRITSGGNVGIGTTTASARLQVDWNAGNQFRASNGSGTFDILNDSTNSLLTSSGPMFYRTGTSGPHIFQRDGGSSEVARIDGSGRLLVGTSSSRSQIGITPLFQVEGTSNTGSIGVINNTSNAGGGYLVLGKTRGSSVGSTASVINGDTVGAIYFNGADGTNLLGLAHIAAEVDGTPGANDMPGRLVFSTTADGASSPTERMRIGSDGYLNTFSSANGIVAKVSAAAGTSTFIYAGNRSATNNADGTTVFYVYSNGNVQNTNGSYTTISDVKLKENIVAAGSQWADLKAIQIRNWNFKAETGYETHRQIGPIAQELETVCPGLVFETPDRDEDGNETGEVTKGVNQSVLYMKAVKALQEAMERIEQLEQRLTDAGIA